MANTITPWCIWNKCGECQLDETDCPWRREGFFVCELTKEDIPICVPVHPEKCPCPLCATLRERDEARRLWCECRYAFHAPLSENMRLWCHAFAKTQWGDPEANRLYPVQNGKGI